MVHPVGKIIRILNKYLGPKYLWVNTIGEGLRKHIHLCLTCTKNLPGKPENCTIAQRNYEYCRENNIGIILVRCPLYGNPVNDTQNDRPTA